MSDLVICDIYPSDFGGFYINNLRVYECEICLLKIQFHKF
jgi:hypothetical protein